MDEKFEQKFHHSLNQSLHSDTEEIGSDARLTGDARSFFSPGQIIDGRFRIVRELGRGGTGIVYLVEQILLKQNFAMKILEPVQVSDEAWRRFQKEAQAAGKLDHPGFVKVHDFGLIDNCTPYFTMDLVQGETLADRLRRNGPMTVAQALPIFIQLCFALDYAHSKGVIHRDIKPSNVAFAQDEAANVEQVKILDFGIAKLAGAETTTLTKVGAVFGTPFYMSPEQCSGHPVDSRSDIYSLGCVFFEVLAGAPPFSSEQALTLMMQHQTEKVPSLKEVSMGGQFPAALETLIRKMLAKNPNQRYQRLSETASDLIEFQQGKIPNLSVAETVVLLSPKSKTKTLLIAMAVIVPLIAFAATSVAIFSQATKPQSKKDVSIASGDQSKPAQPVGSDTTVDLLDSNVDAADEAMTTAEFFSVPEERNGISYRVFNFPKRTPIGEISFIDISTNKEQRKPAVGTIAIACKPGSPCIALRLSWATCNFSPQLLKKFRPDEVSQLSLEDNDYRKHMIPNDIYDNALNFVDGLKSIFYIELPTPVSRASIPHIAQLPHLVSFRCSRTKITGDDLTKLPQLPKMKFLFMSMIKNARGAFPVLKHSRSLLALKVVSDNLNDADLKQIAKISSLRELVLRDNPEITDAGVKNLVGMPHLQSLSLDGCNITPRAIKDLKQLHIADFVSLDLKDWSQSDIDELLKQVTCDVRKFNPSTTGYESIRYPGNKRVDKPNAPKGWNDDAPRAATDYGD
jgi:serine/threonine protein kinase